MRTQDIENTLTQLSAPPAPQDLQARCLATIPASAQKTVPRERVGGFGMTNLRVAAAVTASIVIGLSFWSTRPGSDEGKPASGSVAFAQTLEAMRKVEFFHMKGRQFDTSQKNHWFTGWRPMENWFDARQGLYMETKMEGVPGVNLHIRTGEGFSEFDRHLHLPNGTYYRRFDQSNSLVIDSQPAEWQRMKRLSTDFLLANLAAGVRPNAKAGEEPKPVSSSRGNWKGRETTILTFEIEPPQKDAAKGVRKVRAVLYVDPRTRRLTARQDFHISANVETLVLEYEFDYSQPPASRFDPAPLMKGARIRPANLPKGYVLEEKPQKNAP